MSKEITGWPDSDPYPYRKNEFSEDDTGDCFYVIRDKEHAKTANIEELGDYAYILKPAWHHINYLTKKVKSLETHIKWLRNVGGEQLSIACGVDIMAREMAIEQKQKANTVVKGT